MERDIAIVILDAADHASINGNLDVAFLIGIDAIPVRGGEQSEPPSIREAEHASPGLSFMMAHTSSHWALSAKVSNEIASCREDVGGSRAIAFIAGPRC